MKYKALNFLKSKTSLAVAAKECLAINVAQGPRLPKNLVFQPDIVCCTYLLNNGNTSSALIWWPSGSLGLTTRDDFRATCKIKCPKILLRQKMNSASKVTEACATVSQARAEKIFENMKFD